jgi:hypothetical protein
MSYLQGECASRRAEEEEEDGLVKVEVEVEVGQVRRWSIEVSQ